MRVILFSALMMIEDDDDRDFIQQLFLQNEKAMFTMAYRIVGDPHIAGDMVSASCIRMIEKIDSLKEISGAGRTPYILAIVKNTSLMYLRKRKKEGVRNARYVRMSDAEAENRQPDERLLAEAELNALREALYRLNDKDRDLLVMKYFEQRTDEEIACVREISVNSVRSCLSRARKALFNELGRADQHD